MLQELIIKKMISCEHFNRIIMASSTALNILLITQTYAHYSAYIIFTAGIIGNFLNILVFSTLKIFRNNQCVFYFTTESIANIFQLIIFFLISLLTQIYETDPANFILFWCKFRSIMIILCTVIAFFAISSSAFDQYLSTNHRFYIRRMSTVKLARSLIFIAICISILQCIPVGILLEIRDSLCTVFNPNMSQYISYFYYAILTGILPIFISSLFSILAYRNVRRIIRRQIPIVRRRLDQQLTAMVLIRVIIFVILTFPYSIQRMYIYIAKINQSNISLYVISSLLSVILGTIFNLNYAV